MIPSSPPATSSLTELETYERAAAAGTLPDLIVALERTAGVMSDDAFGREAFTLLARALRRDLAFLIEHPEEVFACLYARCRFHGSPEEAILRTTEPGARVPPFAAQVSVLGDLLERWAAERSRSGRPWVRSLRPPAEALTGPIIEVYPATTIPAAREPWVTSAAFSPDGTALLLGSWLCHARTGAARAKLGYWFGQYLEGGPAMDAFRMTDERIALLAESVEVWSTADGECLVGGPNRSQSRRDQHFHWDLIAISADARRLARTRRHKWERGELSQDEVVVTEIDTGHDLVRFPIQGASCLCFSPDGTRLAAGSRDGVVRVWDAKSGALLTSFVGHRHLVSDVAFLGGGELIVSGAEDDAICLWDAGSGVERLRRDLGEEEPYRDFWSATDGEGRRRYWKATPAAVAEVEVWAALRQRPHPWRARQLAGTLQIVHSDTGQVAATLPTNVEVVPHPDAPIWAGGGLHFVLEDGAGGVPRP